MLLPINIKPNNKSLPNIQPKTSLRQDLKQINFTSLYNVGEVVSFSKYQPLRVYLKNYLPEFEEFKSTEQFLPELKKLEKKGMEIYDKSKKFEITEYKTLSEDEKKHLRLINKGAFADDRFDWRFDNYKEGTIEIGKAYAKKMNELYPQGYMFVSIGRSPALIGKMLEFQGVDVKYCPISGLRGHNDDFSQKMIIEYKKYLQSIGLSKDAVVKSDKPIIFTDFTNCGKSLGRFQDLLQRSEINITEDEKVKFLSLNRNIFDENIDKEYPQYYMKGCIGSGESYYKHYCPIPWLDYRNIKEGSIQEALNKPQENDVKRMMFELIDYLNEHKLLK